MLFRLDPETAHNLAKTVLRHAWLSGLLVSPSPPAQDKRLQVDLGRLRLSNPVGVGAGFDKIARWSNHWGVSVSAMSWPDRNVSRKTGQSPATHGALSRS